MSSSVAGPWNYHVYVGFAKSKEDERMVSTLVAELEKYGVVCSLRTMLNDPGDRASLFNIQHSVRSSRKCLLYVSHDYVKDEWFQIEIEAAVDKARRFSRDSLIVLVAPDFPVEKVPEQLSEFQKINLGDSGKMEDFTSVLAVEIIREPDTKLTVMPKENIGYGAALGYVYGYLRLVLPGFRERMSKVIAESFPRESFIGKMLIVLPEGCFCPPTIGVPVNDKNENGLIQETGKWVERMADRAGNVKRCYKSTIYKALLPTLANGTPMESGVLAKRARYSASQTSKACYFVCELATPLMTMFEAQVYGIAHFTREQLEAERNAFYCTLQALLSHRDNVEWDDDQFKILYWKHGPGFPSTADLRDFLVPVIERELRAEPAVPVTSSSTITVLTKTRMERELQLPDSFVLSGPNEHLISMYERSVYNRYKMTARPRGVCLIISITNYARDCPTGIQIDNRVGAETDAEKLKSLFTELKFHVEVHRDVTEATLENLMLTTAKRNHNEYDAFVCCILSHGSLGQVYTADYKPVKIVNIADFFNQTHCASLKGKPKMFFVQSCQTATCTRTVDISDIDQPTQRDRDDEAEVVAMMGDLNLGQGTCANIASDAIPDPTLSRGDPMSNEQKATLVPGHPDFFMSYATLPLHEAYRNPNEGITFYVEALYQNLRKPKELDRAMKNVSFDVAKQLGTTTARIAGKQLLEAAVKLVGKAAYGTYRAVAVISRDVAVNDCKTAMKAAIGKINCAKLYYNELFQAAGINPITEDSLASTRDALEWQIEKMIEAVSATEQSVSAAFSAVSSVSDHETQVAADQIKEFTVAAITAAKVAVMRTTDPTTAAGKTDDASKAAAAAYYKLTTLTGRPETTIDVLRQVVDVAKGAAKVAEVVSSWKNKFQLPFHLTTGTHKLLYLAE